MHSVPVSDQVHQAAGLGSERSYLAICPACDDTLAIWHELEAVAEGRLAFMLLERDP